MDGSSNEWPFGRRLKQFSLRALLLLLLATAVVTVVVSPWIRRQYDSRLIISGDILGISISGSGMSDGFPVPVRPDGTVGLPLIGDVRVAGLTRQEARTRILEAYASQNRMQTNPPVLVNVFREALPPRPYFTQAELTQRYDDNRNGMIDEVEWDAVERELSAADADGDGRISHAESHGILSNR